jgi:hypothetical protein
MTLTSTITRVNYTASGSNDTFAYTFRIDAESHLEVYLDDAVQGSGYSVTGVGNDGGGNVVFTAAPAASTKVTLLRAVPNTQPTDLPTTGPLDTTAIETQLDQLVMQILAVKDQIARSLVLPVSTALSDLELPTLEASKFLAANAAADGLLWATPAGTGVPVSTFMETLLDDTSGAAGLDTLLGSPGLGEGDTLVHDGAALVKNDAPWGPPNIMHNPEFLNWQRGTSISCPAAATTKTVERWYRTYWSGVETAVQSVTSAVDGGVDGRSQYAEIAVTTAQSSVASGDAHNWCQVMEAIQAWPLIDPATGFMGAFCVSFDAAVVDAGAAWGGTYQATVYARDHWANYQVGKLVGIATGGGWARYTAKFPASRNSYVRFGAGLYYASMEIGFGLMGGSNRTFSADATWEGIGTQKFVVTGGHNFNATPGNKLRITNIDVYPGTVERPFMPVDHGTDWVNCRRHYEKFARGSGDAGSVTWLAQAYSTQNAVATIRYCEKRAKPSITTSGGTHWSALDAGYTTTSGFGTFVVTAAGMRTAQVEFRSGSGLVAGNATVVQDNSSSSYIEIDAALS